MAYVEYPWPVVTVNSPLWQLGDRYFHGLTNMSGGTTSANWNEECQLLSHISEGRFLFAFKWADNMFLQ